MLNQPEASILTGLHKKFLVEWANFACKLFCWLNWLIADVYFNKENAVQIYSDNKFQWSGGREFETRKGPSYFLLPCKLLVDSKLLFGIVVAKLKWQHSFFHASCMEVATFLSTPQAEPIYRPLRGKQCEMHRHTDRQTDRRMLPNMLSPLLCGR